MRTPYTYLEVDSIENDYDQQVSISAITEKVNSDFHKGEKVRTINSVWYVIRKLNESDGWKEKLEEVWLQNIEF